MSCANDPKLDRVYCFGGYSDSQSRFIITIDPENKERFEKEIQDFLFAQIGAVKDQEFIVNEIIKTDVKKLEQIYKERFKDF